MLKAIIKYTPGQKGLWVLEPLTFCCIGPGCLLSDNEFLAFSLTSRGRDGGVLLNVRY
jgi:hypothetical protein